MSADEVEAWKASVRAALVVAMRERDKVGIGALRSALSAVDNAEAPDLSVAPEATQGTIAGGVAGLGAGEVARLLLSLREVQSIVRQEIETRSAAADEYERHGRLDQAQTVRAEVEILERHLPGASSTALTEPLQAPCP